MQKGGPVAESLTKSLNLCHNRSSSQQPGGTVLEKLRVLFVGKKIRITHINMRMASETGVCVQVHELIGGRGGFDVELADGSRFGFIPDKVTADAAEGELRAFSGARRKFEVVEQ
jgi:hypothetical protein